MPPRTAAALRSYRRRPGSAPGGGSRARNPIGRGVDLRRRRMRVRIPPSTRCSSSNSCLLSGNGKHASLVRRQSGFDSPGRLASTCGCSSARSEHFPAKEEVARSNRVSHSCRTRPTGRGAPLRPGRFAVRIRGSARRVNQPGCWASLLTTARFIAVAFESPALFSWMVNRTGAPASFGTRMRANPRRIVSAAILGTRTCRVAGAASRADGRATVGVGTSSFLVEPRKMRRRRGTGP